MVSLQSNDQSSHFSAGTRIVGIGASAGGLLPLEQFIENIPANSGMAYIVVQHLDPTQITLLPEILQRVTQMPMFEVTQQMPVKPNSVYVIKPNTEITVVNGTLHLARPDEPRGLRLPINILFSSLASDQGERAIAVILSGMGSDGTLGMQAIKAVGGLNVVQEPASAQFDSMPKSALTAGCADIIGLPVELPKRILAFVDKVQGQTAASADEKDLAPESAPLQRILSQLQQRTRHDFSLYKPTTLHRRIERRMAIHNIDTLASYADFNARNVQELDLLFRELLIGVTSFFRDLAVWNYLAEKTLPDLLARCSGKLKLRAWVIGCSTGEEAYSLAMVTKSTVTFVIWCFLHSITCCLIHPSLNLICYLAATY